MKNIFKHAAMVGAVTALATTGLFAQVKNAVGPDGVVRNVGTNTLAADPPPGKSAFGSGSGSLTYEWLSAENMSPRYSTVPWGQAGSYNYKTRTGGTDPYFQTTINLPSGISLGGMRLMYEDTNLTANMNPTLWLCTVEVDNSSGTNPVIDCPSSVSGSDAVNGAGSVVLNLNQTIYNVDPVTNRERKYIVYVDIPTTDGSVRFGGVRMFWTRQVSPAPLTATFGDVPVGSGLHKFVEALYAAGITGGCAGGNFCPGDPLTRGQMAVFLSTALGLHESP